MKLLQNEQLGRKVFLQEEKCGKIIRKQRHRICNIEPNFYEKKFNQGNDRKNYHEFRCHVIYGKLGRKHKEPQGFQNTSHLRIK